MSLQVFESCKASPTSVALVLVLSGVCHELDSITVFRWSSFLEIGYPRMRWTPLLLTQWVTPISNSLFCGYNRGIDCVAGHLTHL